MNFYILIFLTAFFASMTILTTLKIVNGETEDPRSSLSLQGLANLECRENYHEYCFGEKWNTIVELSDQIKNMTDKLYSDEAFLCKHKNHIYDSTDHEIVCIEINDEEIKDIDTKYEQFKNDLDTFSITELMPNMESMH